MMQICIMIVGDADQPFTVNEIPYLEREFSQIHIFALNAKRNDHLKVDFPPQVVVHPVGVAHGTSRIPKYVLRGLWSTEPELKIDFGNFKRLLTTLYARGRSERVYRDILSVIDREGLVCSDGVVYSYWFTDQAIVAWRLAAELNRRGGRFKSFSRAHGYDLYWERNPAGFLPYQDLSIRKLDGTYPCSEFGVRYLQSKYPTSAGRVRVARLGTKDYGLGGSPKKDVIFVTCCRMIGLKRMQLFAKAFCQLCSRNAKCRWICIGDGEELEAVKAVVRGAGATSAVEFKGGIENEKIMTLYKTTPISYFVNVSASEGIPVAIMEAMSFGIPVIATDVGGSGELVSDDCGFLISANLDVDKLERVLEGALHLPSEEYASKRNRARAIWEERASADTNYREWCRILTAD